MDGQRTLFPRFPIRIVSIAVQPNVFEPNLIGKPILGPKNSGFRSIALYFLGTSAKAMYLRCTTSD